MARYPAVPRIYDYLKDNPEAERVLEKYHNGVEH